MVLYICILYFDINLMKSTSRAPMALLVLSTSKSTPTTFDIYPAHITTAWTSLVTKPHYHTPLQIYKLKSPQLSNHSNLSFCKELRKTIMSSSTLFHLFLLSSFLFSCFSNARLEGNYIHIHLYIHYYSYLFIYTSNW